MTTLWLFALWDSFVVFTTLMLVAVGGIGLTSRSFSVAAMGSYLTFAYIAMETGYTLFENILYVTAVLVFVGTAFKVWRLEGGGV